uniref:NAD dependent epimerase/dehydratase family protein n=2 Tax=Erysipelothrix rhusiopathiae TaxID=1648 RepID=A0A4P2VC51_ERYRH|nr:NAD dependent epimerase/dehydratase family protein [Erysipelothrix rhusiopathiae]
MITTLYTDQKHIGGSKMTKNNILVLGATGNLGAYSAISLKNNGFNVIAAGRRKSDNGFYEDHGIPYYSIDITRKEDFEQLNDLGIDTVVHLAGELPSRCAFNPALLIETITEGTLNVLEFMKNVGAKKIIFPTTPYDVFAYHENGEPMDEDLPRSFPLTGDHSIYAIAKNAAVDLIEHYHHEIGIQRFVLRFFTIYQYHPNAYHYVDMKKQMMPYRSLIKRAQNGEEITIYGDPTRVKEMVYIKDFTQVIVKASESSLEGGIYNIGSPNRVSLEEMIRGIVEVFSPADNKSKISNDYDKPDTLQSMLDYSKTINDLGYEPKYDYISMLEDFKSEMTNNPFEKLWGKPEDYENN